MKTYNVTYDRKKNRGVYAISLVENPAMEENFIALAKQKQVLQLKTIDEAKRELIGVVLEPNKPIYRDQNGEQFNIVFTEDVIKELLIGFSENGNQNNSTIEHEEALKLDGVTFFENWIVEDEENDKSNAYELNAKKGSWVTKLKIDDEDVWNDFVKTGAVKGFSIDAMVDLQEIKLNSNMNKVELNDESKGFIESLFSKFLSPKEPKVELAEEKPAEPVALEEEKEEKKEEDVNMMTDEMKAEIKTMINEVVREAMDAMKGDVDSEMKKVKEENVAMKAELKRIGELPASEPVKSQPTQNVQNLNLSKKGQITEFLNTIK